MSARDSRFVADTGLAALPLWRPPTPMKTPGLSRLTEPTKLHALRLLDVKPGA